MAQDNLPIPSALTLLGRAWQVYRRQALTLIGIMVAPIIGFIIIASLFNLVAGIFGALFGLGIPPDNPKEPSLGVVILAILLVLALIIGALFIFAWANLALIYAIRGNSFINAFKESLRNVKSYFWILVLTSLLLLGLSGFYERTLRGDSGSASRTATKPAVRNFRFIGLSRLSHSDFWRCNNRFVLSTWSRHQQYYYAPN